MKPCRHFGVTKSLADFYKHPRMADGHLNVCKTCRDACVTEYTRKHRDRLLAQRNAACLRMYYRNGAAARAKNAENQRRRQAHNGNQAMPAWANRFFIDETYSFAQLKSDVSGIKHNVDHIVPLKSPVVCGLHTHENLRVIPGIENRSKRNRWWPDMPSEMSV
jgi:hypothetical protein